MWKNILLDYGVINNYPRLPGSYGGKNKCRLTEVGRWSQRGYDIRRAELKGYQNALEEQDANLIMVRYKEKYTSQGVGDVESHIQSGK